MKIKPYETKYAHDFKIKGNYEGVTITENIEVKEKPIIKIELFQERWRSPQETIDLLEKVVGLIKDNFI